MVSRRTGKIDGPSRTYVKSWRRESSARLFTNTTILLASKPKCLLLLHSSSDLAPLVRTGAPTRPLSVALTIRAAARALCSALCPSSLLAYFRVGWADIERVVCTLRRYCISTRPRKHVECESLKTTTSYMWARSAHCAFSCALASFVHLLLRVCNIGIESGFLLPCTLIVRCTLTILGRLRVDAVLILRILPRQGGGKGLGKLALSWYSG